MNDKITLKDVYQIMNRVEDKLDSEIRELKAEVTLNSNFRNQWVGRITVLVAIIGIGVNILLDYIFKK